MTCISSISTDIRQLFDDLETNRCQTHHPKLAGVVCDFELSLFLKDIHDNLLSLIFKICQNSNCSELSKTPTANHQSPLKIVNKSVSCAFLVSHWFLTFSRVCFSWILPQTAAPEWSPPGPLPQSTGPVPTSRPLKSKASTITTRHRYKYFSPN